MKKYYIKGIHCTACEIVIEKELKSFRNIKKFELSTTKGELEIDFYKKPLTVKKLNEIFFYQGYIFSEKPFSENLKENKNKKDYLIAFVIAVLFISGFLFLNKLSFLSFDLTEKSNLSFFFIFGLIASLSSCMALIGGIILSLSKKWHSQSKDKNSFIQKIQPHFLFNFGRIMAFVLLGGMLGIIGNKIQISLTVTSIFIILVSLMMIFLGIQMLGINFFSKIKIPFPKFIKKYFVEDIENKNSRFPFLIGASTVFLPCGFTMSVQGVALLSGNFFWGALIMFVFVLGTTPVLLMIGVSSVKFYEKTTLASRFSKVAGVLVLFFALFNINSQLNVLGYLSLNDIKIKSSNGEQDALVRGDFFEDKKNEANDKTIQKQVIKMDADSRRYSPNFFEVEVGIPVRWEIRDIGTSGCTNAIIAKDFFKEEIKLKPGGIVVKEFIPKKIGNYKFSCWMGMVSGTIRVVEKKNG